MHAQGDVIDRPPGRRQLRLGQVREDTVASSCAASQMLGGLGIPGSSGSPRLGFLIFSLLPLPLPFLFIHVLLDTALSLVAAGDHRLTLPSYLPTFPFISSSTTTPETAIH